MTQAFKQYSNYDDYLNDVESGIFNVGISIQYIDDTNANINMVIFREGNGSSSKIINNYDYTDIKNTKNDLSVSYWVENDGKNIIDLINKINKREGYISKEELEVLKTVSPNFLLRYLYNNEYLSEYEDLPLYKILSTPYSISDINADKYALLNDSTLNKEGNVKLTDVNELGKDLSNFYYSIGCLSDIHHDCSYDNDYYEHGGTEEGNQAASDLNNALHYFETKENVKFVTVSGDLTVQQGENSRPFIFNNFIYEAGNFPEDVIYIDWSEKVLESHIVFVKSSEESGCETPGQAFNIEEEYYDFIFTDKGQRTLIDIQGVPNKLPKSYPIKSKINITGKLFYNNVDVTEIFNNYYASKGLNYIPIGFYDITDEIYKISGIFNSHIKNYSDFYNWGIEIGTSNSKIESLGWPTECPVNENHPLTVRIYSPKFVCTEYEVLDKSFVADLDSFKYNAFNKIAPETPIFVARGNHDIGAISNAHYNEKMNRNALGDTSIEENEKLWAYYTHPTNNKLIPSSLNIIYQYPDLGRTKANSSNYYIQDTSTGDIFIFFSLANNSFWGGDTNPYLDEDYKWLENVLDTYRNHRTFVFLHLFFDAKCGGYKHIYPAWGDDKGANAPMYFNEQYLKLQYLSDYYKNSIWVSGHSHWRWCCQSKDENANIYHKTVNNELGEYGGWCIHIPSCAYPRTDNGDETSLFDMNYASEGAIIDIYKDYIELHGIIFKDAILNNSEWSRLSPTTPTDDYVNLKSGIANYRLPVGGKNLIEVESRLNKNYIVFETSGEQTLSIYNLGNTPNIEISTDTISWTPWDYTPINFDKDNPIYVRGYNPFGFSQSATKFSSFRFDKDDAVYCYGDIMYLISYDNYTTEIPNERCFVNLFQYCEELVIAPFIGATIYKDYCFDSMFSGCVNLGETAKMNDAEIAYRCCVDMYNGCTNLQYAHELPASKLANNCYERMFAWCESLIVQPNILATELADYCCYAMFDECHSLTTAKTININECAPYCYDNMFHNCYSLTTPPELPATIVAEGCYTGMFHSCTSLIEGPALPAIELVYKGDDTFKDPTEGVITWHCGDEARKLTKEEKELFDKGNPYLTAEQYLKEFENTSEDINFDEGDFGISFNTIENQFFDNDENKCKFIYKTVDNTIVDEFIIEGWGAGYVNNIYENGVGVILFDEPITSIPSSVFRNNDKLIYVNIPKNVTSINSYAFENCTLLESVSINNYDIELIDTYSFANCNKLSTIIFNGVEFTDFNIFRKALDNDFVADITSFENTLITQNPVPSDMIPYDICSNRELFGCYSMMFYNCTNLKGIKGNILPATVLANYCYTGMFGRCESLEEAPELPALELKDWCYADMFIYCRGLVKCPELPATKLAICCYGSWYTLPIMGVQVFQGGMFRGCNKISEYPTELPATNLSMYCYNLMFSFNYGMVQAPTLPAITLQKYCYSNIFTNCTTLSKARIYGTNVSGNSNTEVFTENSFNNVQQSGTIYYNSYCTNTHITSYFPSRWSKIKSKVNPNKEVILNYKTFNNYNSLNPNLGFKSFIDNTISYYDTYFNPNSYEGQIKVGIYNADNNIVVSYTGFIGKNITSITLSENINKISKYGFANCSTLKEVALGDNLEIIDDYAFSGCTALKEFTIPNTVKELGNYVFNGCTNLTNIIIPEDINIKYYGNGKFRNTKIENITLPACIDTIKKYDFYMCKNLVTVNTLGKLKYISANAFSGCTSLKNIDLTEVTTIEDSAFTNTDIEIFNFPPKCNTINCIFGNTAITSYKFPRVINFGNKRTTMPELYLVDDSVNYLPFKITDELIIIVPNNCYDDIINDDNWSIYHNYIIKYKDYYNTEGSTNRIEIGMFGGSYLGYNKVNFEGIKEMGFDWIYLKGASNSSIKKMMEGCYNNNLRLYVDGYYDFKYYNNKQYLLKYYEEYPGTLKGYMVCDEPYMDRLSYYTSPRSYSSLSEVEYLMGEISYYDVNNHDMYVNAFPNYASEGQITNNFYGYKYNNQYYIENPEGEYLMYYPNKTKPSCLSSVFVKKTETKYSSEYYSTESYSLYSPWDENNIISDDKFYDYIESLAKISKKSLSGDYYGLLADSNSEGGYKVRPNYKWIKYLDTFRILADKYNKEIWQYICCTKHGSYPKPTRDNLRYYININLMYGVSTIMYFMLAEYNGSTSEYSPFDTNGNKKETFDIIKDLHNTDLINNGKYFKGSIIDSVHLYNESNPLHKYVTSINGDYIITDFHKDDIYMLAIFNYGDSTNTITIKSNNIAFNIENGKIKPFINENSTITLNIDKGDIKIFILKDKPEELKEEDNITYSISSETIYITKKDVGDIVVNNKCKTYNNGYLIKEEYIENIFDRDELIETIKNNGTNYTNYIRYIHELYYNDIKYLIYFNYYTNDNFIIQESTNNIGYVNYNVPYGSFNTLSTIYEYLPEEEKYITKGNLTNSKTFYYGYNETSENKKYLVEMPNSKGTTTSYYIVQTPNYSNKLAIRPIVVDTRGYQYSDSSISKYTVSNTTKLTINSTGNMLFFNRILSNHNIKYISDVRAFKVDDYGFCIYKYIGKDKWGGGSGSGGTDKEFIINFTDDKTFTIVCDASVDEDNTIYFKSLFTNLSIRVPYTGMKIKLMIDKFPYTYTSDYYYKLYNSILSSNSIYYDKNVYIKKEAINVLLDNCIEAKNMISNVQLSKGINLQEYLSFDVAENKFDYYKEFYVINDKISFNIIQEPLSKRRIYYGISCDSYLAKGIYDYKGTENDYICASIFLLNNSEIIESDTFEIYTRAQINTGVYRTLWYFAIPVDIFISISSESDNLTLLNKSFKWGNQDYIIYKTNTYTATNISIKLT